MQRSRKPAGPTGAAKLSYESQRLLYELSAPSRFAKEHCDLTMPCPTNEPAIIRGTPLLLYRLLVLFNCFLFALCCPHRFGKRKKELVLRQGGTAFTGVREAERTAAPHDASYDRKPALPGGSATGLRAASPRCRGRARTTGGILQRGERRLVKCRLIATIITD